MPTRLCAPPGGLGKLVVDTDSTIAPPQNQRYSLTNVSWLLDTRKDKIETKESIYFLVCKGTTLERDAFRHGVQLRPLRRPVRSSGRWRASRRCLSLPYGFAVHGHRHVCCLLRLYHDHRSVFPGHLGEIPSFCTRVSPWPLSLGTQNRAGATQAKHPWFPLASLTWHAKPRAGATRAKHLWFPLAPLTWHANPRAGATQAKDSNWAWSSLTTRRTARSPDKAMKLPIPALRNASPRLFAMDTIR